MRERNKTAIQTIKDGVEKLFTNKGNMKHGACGDLPLNQQDLPIVQEFAVQIFENKVLRSGLWTIERAIKVTIEVVYRLIYIDPKKIDLLRKKDMGPIELEMHLMKSAEIA
jgi:hypothetical protein